MYFYPKVLLVALMFAALGFSIARSQEYWPLGVSCTMSGEPLSTGQPFHFTLSITNMGASDAFFVSIKIIHYHRQHPAEAVWFLSIPSSFTISSDTLQTTLTHLPVRGSVKYSFTAVGLRAGGQGLFASAYADNAETGDTFSGTHDRSFTVSQGPGLITFDKQAYVIPETGAATISVRRVGGSDTPVSVSFATSNGTAIADSNFLPASGRLQFDRGEQTNSIVIPAIYNPAPGCNTAFTFHLFNSGAFLARYTNARVMIADAPHLVGYIRPVSVSAIDPRKLTGARASSSALSRDGGKLAFLDSKLGDRLAPFSEWRLVFHDLTTRSDQRIALHFPDDEAIITYDSGLPILSGDGRVIAAAGLAYDLNQQRDFDYILLRSISSQSNIVLRRSSARQAFGSFMLSSNGAALAYEVWGPELNDRIFVYDLSTGSNTKVNIASNGDAANFQSGLLALDPTGRYVVFQSGASNLTPNDTNMAWDIFLHDRNTRNTELISVNGSGLGPRARPSSGPASISSNGRYVMFVGSRNTVPPGFPGSLTHIFVRDRIVRITRRASVEPAQTQGEYFAASSPSMSDDGRYVAYESFDLRSKNTDRTKERVDVYVTDMQTGESTLVSANCQRTGRGNARSYSPRMSGNGAYVFFFSYADNLVPGEFFRGECNLFRWERATSRTSLVSANTVGTGGVSGEHTHAGPSHDGSTISFASSATNLVFGDVNSQIDLFVWTAANRPALSATRVNGVLTISWPTEAPPCILEHKGLDGDWATAEGQIDISNGHYLYRTSVQDTVTTRFFRLRLL